ncbi:hypothetical protein BH11PSE11_BH11PSE11_25770 [soil metagenome]
MLAAGGATDGARSGLGASTFGASAAGLPTGALACAAGLDKLQPHLPQNLAVGLLTAAHCGHTLPSIAAGAMLATATVNRSPHDLQ